MLIALAFLIGENVHDLHLVRRGGDGVKLVPEEDRVGRAVAEEDRETEVLDTVADGARHGVKRRDAAAAGECNDVRRVAVRFIVERTEPLGAEKPVALLEMVEQPVRGKAGGIALDGDGDRSFQRLFRGGGDGVRTADKALADGELERHILSGAEVRGRFAVRAAEHERFGAGGRTVNDLIHDESLEIRVQRLGKVVDGIIGGDLLRRSFRDDFFSLLAEIGELQHIQKADKPDFYVQRHYCSPPLSSSAQARPAVMSPLIQVEE